MSIEGFNNQEPHEEVERKEVDGVVYERVPSGYTIREYFSHETEEKGPGPGWDSRRSVLEKYNVTEPSDLPDEPHYNWIAVSEE